MEDFICQLPAYQKYSIFLIGYIADNYWEYRIGKSDKIKGSSKLECLINGIKALIAKKPLTKENENETGKI